MRYLCWLLLLIGLQAQAEITPGKSPYDARVRVIDYNRMDVVKLTTFYGVSTHVQFGDDESVRDVAIGDDQAWNIVPRGNHLFIKPKAKKADTNVTVVTDKRVYNFALVVEPRSVKDSDAWKDPNLVYGVTFKYPDEEAAKRAAMEAEMLREAEKRKRLELIKTRFRNVVKPEPESGPSSAVSQAVAVAAEPYVVNKDVPLEKQNYHYSMAGSTEISPTAARDDGRFIYLVFSRNRDMPAVYSVDSTGKEALINTSVEGNTIIVHRVVPMLRLRKGEFVVCVRNDAFEFDGGKDNALGTIAPGVERVVKERRP